MNVLPQWVWRSNGRKSLNVREMMRIGADDCVKCECNTHYAKNESEAIPAERNGRAERSREKMNVQRVRMILVSNLNHFLLRPCLSAKFSSVLTEMPMAGAWCENMDVSLRFQDEEG